MLTLRDMLVPSITRKLKVGYLHFWQLKHIQRRESISNSTEARHTEFRRTEERLKQFFNHSIIHSEKFNDSCTYFSDRLYKLKWTTVGILIYAGTTLTLQIDFCRDRGALSEGWKTSWEASWFRKVWVYHWRSYKWHHYQLPWVKGSWHNGCSMPKLRWRR